MPARAGRPLPLLSFIIPVRNDAERLARCLRSIAALDYPRDHVEIIVADNGSTDGSADVARRAGAVVLGLPGLRVAALRNRGAEAARGAVLAFVDADHEIDAAWARSACETLGRPGVAVAGSLCSAPPGGTWVQRMYDACRHRPKGRHEVEWLGSGNMAVWRGAFARAEGFDDTLETCEDVDLCQRLRQAGYRVVSDDRLKSVHLGDPATLWALFAGELWRGRDNIRASLRGPFTWRSLPSVAIPIIDLSWLLLAAAGLLTAGRGGLALTLLGTCVVGGLAAVRAARMLANVSPLSAPIPKYGNSSPERGARIARRDDRAYREYARKEQRREAGCPARNTWAYFGIGALSLRAAAQAFAVASVYDVARALAPVSGATHRVRRS